MTTESQDPAVFVAGKKILLFHRAAAHPALQILDPTNATPPTSDVAIEALGKGDPWDVVGLATNSADTVLFATSPAMSSIVKIPLSNPASASAVDAAWSLPQATKFRPTGLFQSGDRLFLNHQGVTVNGDVAVANGSQTLFALNVSDPMNPLASSLGTSRSIDATGIQLSSSTTQRFSNKKHPNPALVGLCNEELGVSCTAGADRLNPTTGKITKNGVLNASLQNSDYRYFNQVIDGESESITYIQAHKVSANKKVLMRLDSASGALTDTHTYNDDRLYTAFTDESTGTVFVGDFSDMSGEFVLYKNNSKIGSFELPSVPYSAALVPL